MALGPAEMFCIVTSAKSGGELLTKLGQGGGSSNVLAQERPRQTSELIGSRVDGYYSSAPEDEADQGQH
jgi:hypothetical protein